MISRHVSVGFMWREDKPTPVVPANAPQYNAPVTPRTPLPLRPLRWSIHLLCGLSGGSLLIFLLAMGIGAGRASTGATNPSPDDQKKDLPEIRVQILGSTDRLKGHKWPRGYDWVHDKPNQ